MGVKHGLSFLREEQRLRVFENRMIRKISGPYSEEVTGQWIRTNKAELNDIYRSRYITLTIYTPIDIYPS
jgi:hypothetical protein